MRSTPKGLCKNCFQQTEDGKSKLVEPSLEGVPTEVEDKRYDEISRGEPGITFEVFTTFQQERLRANMLMAKAADAFVRRETRPTEDARGAGHAPTD